MTRVGLPSAALRERILKVLAWGGMTSDGMARMLGRNPAHVAAVMRCMRAEGCLLAEPKRSARGGRPALVYRRASA